MKRLLLPLCLAIAFSTPGLATPPVEMGGLGLLACGTGALETHQLGPCMAVGLVGRTKDHRIAGIALAHINPTADESKMIAEMADHLKARGAVAITAKIAGGWEPSKGSPDLWERIQSALQARAIRWETVEGFTNRAVTDYSHLPYTRAYLGCDGSIRAEEDPAPSLNPPADNR